MKKNILSRFQGLNILLISCLTAIFISKLDDYIVSISLPEMAGHFDVSTSIISRVTLIYFLVLTSTLLIWGKLGDRIGFKKILLIGFLIFGISSFCCGFATDINFLIFFRFFQGIGASILLVTSQAMIAYYIAPEQQARAFGFLTTSAAVGMSLGPTIGGLITEYFSWNWIFWINIPVCIIIIVTLSLIKSKKETPGELPKPVKQKFDIIGSILIFLGLTSFVFAVNMGHELNWNYIIISSLVVSFILLILFIIRENNCSHPLLDITLLKNIPFTMTVITACIAFLLIGGNLFLMPFYLIYVKSLSNAQAGFVMMFYPLCFLIMSLFVGKILKTHSCITIWLSGMGLALISLIFFSLTIRLPGTIFTIVFLSLMGIGLGLFFAPNTKYAMDFVCPHNAGMASGIYRTFNNIGMVLGICLFELIYSHFAAHMVNSSTELQITGFQYAYIFGTSMAVIAILITLYIKTIPRPE
jgi:EmrB/QacA subfamily drug resistance transporter